AAGRRPLAGRRRSRPGPLRRGATGCRDHHRRRRRALDPGRPAGGAGPPGRGVPRSLMAGEQDPGPAELADLQAEIGKIAHRLHNHLTVVIGHTELARRLLRRAPDEPPRDDVLADLDAVAKATT